MNPVLRQELDDRVLAAGDAAEKMRDPGSGNGSGFRSASNSANHAAMAMKTAPNRPTAQTGMRIVLSANFHLT